MKKIFIFIGLLLFLSGCGKNDVDLSQYDKLELTKDNISDYIDLVRLSGNYDEKTVDLTFSFESSNYDYIFEDVSFDVEIIECYKYDILLNTQVSDNIYIKRNRVTVDEKGISDEYNFRQSVSHKIKSLCSGDAGMYIASNVKGYVYIPWEK